MCTATTNPYQCIDTTDCPREYVCPITYEIMDDPVKLGDTNHIFNRRAISHWLRGHNRDPMTNLPLANRSLVSHVELKSQIDSYVLSLSGDNSDSNSNGDSDGNGDNSNSDGNIKGYSYDESNSNSNSNDNSIIIIQTEGHSSPRLVQSN